MASATLLLPAVSRFAGQPVPAALAKALGRADREAGKAGYPAQLRRHFRLVPDHWPVAALTRQLDAGDASHASWLRVDPAHVAPDMGGARMLSHGDALALTVEDVAQLLPALRPLFGDAGFPLDAPTPSRWYMRLPRDSRLPVFDTPDEVLGEDLFAHLPQGDVGRRWRALLTEAQVVLHNHPWNAVRASLGRPAVNSLWFWGAGAMPDFVSTRYRQVKGSDALLRSLAVTAGVSNESVDSQEVDALVDLRHLRDLGMLARDALQPLLEAVRTRELEALTLDFEDGAIFHLRREQKWRFWRKPLPVLA